MNIIGQISYLDGLMRISHTLDQMLPADENGSRNYVFLEALRRSLASICKEGKTGGLQRANMEAMRVLAVNGSPERREPERKRLVEVAKLGGASRSKRKKAAAKKNGKKGGRPILDKKTLSLSGALLAALKRQNHDAWLYAANYAYLPRVLRALATRMKQAGITNEALRLPREWDPSPQSKDPHKRYADFARRQGFWLKSHPPRQVPPRTQGGVISTH